MTRVSNVDTSSLKSANVRSITAGFVPINSHPLRSSSRSEVDRTIERSRRRTRLRFVAEPTGRPTENATRSGTAEGSLT